MASAPARGCRAQCNSGLTCHSGPGPLSLRPQPQHTCPGRSGIGKVRIGAGLHPSQCDRNPGPICPAGDDLRIRTIRYLRKTAGRVTALHYSAPGKRNAGRSASRRRREAQEELALAEAGGSGVAMIALLNAINLALFGYYLFTNLTYLFLLVSAISANIMHQRRLASLKLEHVDLSPFTPPIALLVPARNEEGCVVESIRSLLGIDYPEFEIVLINDGSTDGTLKQVQEHFKLRKANLLYVPEVRCAEVHALYISTVDRRLLVVDKESGGNKSDAVNAGLNATSSPSVC